MNAEQAREVIRKAVDKAGSQLAFAKAHGISASFVNETLKGAEPSAKILAAVGLERAPLSYRRKQSGVGQADAQDDG